MQKRRKILFLLVDGVADYNHPAPSPLSQNLTHLHSIAASGLNGIMDPVQAGLACGSDTAHMNIFGYNPFEHYTGRGAFEALGSGLTLQEDQIGFKCNFAHMDQEGIVIKRRVDRDFPKWGIPLVDCVNQGKLERHPEYTYEAIYANEHRCAIKISGPRISSFITGTDPLKDKLPLRRSKACLQGDQHQRSAQVLNQVSQVINRLLQNHPINVERREKGLLTANVVLFRGAGKNVKLQKFDEKWGFRSAAIVPTKIVRGLAISLGMQVKDVQGATGDYHSDYKAKMKQAVNLLRQGYNFVFTHFKSVDQACHDKDLPRKLQILRKFDQSLGYLFELLKGVGEDFIICVTGDHSSPVEIGQHSFQPVPFAITSWLNIKQGKEISFRSDEVRLFTETTCSAGLLGRFNGGVLMRWLSSLQ